MRRDLRAQRGVLDADRLRDAREQCALLLQVAQQRLECGALAEARVNVAKLVDALDHLGLHGVGALRWLDETVECAKKAFVCGCAGEWRREYMRARVCANSYLSKAEGRIAKQFVHIHFSGSSQEERQNQAKKSYREGKARG